MFKKQYLIGFAMLLLAVIVGTVLLVVATSNTAGGNTSVSEKDPGVSACMTMAAPAEHPKLDEEWYKQRLTMFGTSKFEDIRTAGTKVTNAAYRLENEMATADLDKLNAMTSELNFAHVQLRIACKNHGVDLSPLT